MTQERFFQIVDDPDILRRITYEELKTLALAYPYAHNLRCLLAIKARQIDHPGAAQDLATAATYSQDRTKLFLLVAPQVVAPQQVLSPEEVLELKPIETVKRELEALAPIVREEKSMETVVEMEITPVPEPPAQVVFEEKFTPAAIAAPSVTPVRQTFSEWIGGFQPPTLEGPIRKFKVPNPVPVVKEKAEETSKLPGIAQQLAERSVAENEDVISETLAKLYAKQGYRDKSAQMYARLALLFPEKSAYFAAEIDKLKK